MAEVEQVVIAALTQKLVAGMADDVVREAHARYGLDDEGRRHFNAGAEHVLRAIIIRGTPGLAVEMAVEALR